MPIEVTALAPKTKDDVTLSVERHRDPAQKSRGAVLLQHGLASNNGAFVVPQQSFADHLASLGYDCFVTELRSHGKSERAKRTGFDAFIEQDLPVFIETAQQASGHATLAWIGHSMGGILGLSYGIEHPDAPFSSVIAVCSSLDYRPGTNVYQRLNRIRPLAHLLPFVPYRLLAQMNAPFAGAGPVLPPEAMNFHRSNMERELLRHCLATGFERIEIQLLDDLATTFDDAGFSRAEGGIKYLERASDYGFRTLLIGGSADVQCGQECIDATMALLSGARDKRSAMLGKAFGHQDDYGHFDPLVGRNATTEAWPMMTSFLEGR